MCIRDSDNTIRPITVQHLAVHPDPELYDLQRPLPGYRHIIQCMNLCRFPAAGHTVPDLGERPGAEQLDVYKRQESR